MPDSQQAVDFDSMSDGERFERLYRANYAAVLAYALRRTAAEQAHDAAAETFLIAWRRLGDVPSDARPWLLGVARRVLANQRRSDRRRVALTARLANEPPAARGHEESGTPSVLAALAELAERDREALLLVAWEGLDHPQAAAAIGCSRPAFAVRLHRARRRLLKALEPGGQVAREDPSSGVSGIGLEEQA
jgi:RNA polymerase sigma-70 factor (ECF subfamily)